MDTIIQLGRVKDWVGDVREEAGEKVMGERIKKEIEKNCINIGDK